jgi:hypothetical protein
MKSEFVGSSYIETRFEIWVKLSGPSFSNSHTLDEFYGLKWGPTVLNLGSAYARPAWPTHPT